MLRTTVLRLSARVLLLSCRQTVWTLRRPIIISLPSRTIVWNLTMVASSGTECELLLLLDGGWDARLLSQGLRRSSGRRGRLTLWGVGVKS